MKRFLDVLDEPGRLNIEYISFRENIDTGGPLCRAIIIHHYYCWRRGRA